MKKKAHQSKNINTYFFIIEQIDICSFFNLNFMIEKEHQELIDSYIENIKKFIVDAGGLFPHLTIFADNKDPKKEEKKALIHIPIPDSYMQSDAEKDSLVDEIFPFIYEKVKQKFTPYGIAWASEAWMRIVTEKQMARFKELPPNKEVVVISIDTDYKCETIIYELKRTGQCINSEGDLIDQIQLEKLEQSAGTSGRFVGLYQKLKV